ncbi:MAG TPA: phosphoenolpyruvate--protein phosphotransferase [Candidatus Dormibacteraeota bacterium]|nr:phosphoenolpyruvate--protein phosphotransferase [Candidatus Dormibacteraeota bacterium]
MATGARLLRGVPVSGGRARGPLHVVEEDTASTATPAAPLDALRAAAERAAAELEDLAGKVRSENPQGAEVLEAQALMVRDPALEAAVLKELETGSDLRRAVERALEGYAAQLEQLEDDYLAARAADVREAGRLLLAALAGRPASRLASLTRPAVVVARELSPADTLAADPGLLLAIVTEAGGPTSHAAIVARELGIPAVMGVEGAVAAAAGGRAAEVDGDAGTVWLLPEAPTTAEITTPKRLALTGLPVPVMANAGSPASAAAAAARGAAGIGLFRTELLFLGRPEPMSEEEQTETYERAARALAPHPVIVRTLDVGSDKALPYLPAEREPNPALGRRGIRLWLARPELARPQVRALLRAAAVCPNLRVMVPMVAAVEEVRAARELFVAEARSLQLAVPRLGMMLETPAAALHLTAFRGLVDFISLGTNDLAQYALGADRELEWGPELSETNPGVLRLIATAVEAARALGMEAGACGEMAGTPEGAVFLVGVGVGSLSMGLRAMEAVAEALARASQDGCREAAAAALDATTAAEARAALRSAFAPA